MGNVVILPQPVIAPSPLMELLFSEVGNKGSFDWSAERRCSGLLIRAIFNIVHCDEILQTILLSKAKRSDHAAIEAALRKHQHGITKEFEKDTNWQLWSISCDISDAQHRVAATFDRCVNRWLLRLGQNSELSEKQKREEAQHFEANAPQWVGSRLTVLQYLIKFMRHFLSDNSQTDTDIQKFIEVCKRSNTYIDEISAALAKFVDTASAADAIGIAQKTLFGEFRNAEMDATCSAGDFINRMKSDSELLSDLHCLAITIGRVNDFKHRYTNPIDRKKFEALDGYGHRHVELAITAQALRAVIRFFNEMTEFMKIAPEHVKLQGA